MARDLWSHRIAGVLCLATLGLLAAGALVTGTGSSLAVPDWPLAYGQVFPPMVGGILYEHGHRLVAATVGFLTLVLAGWLFWVDERSWVKWLGLVAVALVVFQGTLGGITVLYLLPKAISISHAMVAHLFFLVTVALFQITSPRWRGPREAVPEEAPRRLKLLAGAAVGTMLLELLLGATMRHHGAGLAIPDFPLAYGRIIPPIAAFPVLIHFLHRLGALLVVAVVAVTLWEAFRRHRREKLLFRPAAAMGVLLLVQVGLGATAIWSQLAVPVTTLHLVNGALLTGVSGMLMLRAYRMEWEVSPGGAQS